MSAIPETRVSLLLRIRNPNDSAAWHEFYQLYALVIYGFARNRGLQDADASDLMQDVLRSLAKNAPNWTFDPSKGTFRGWLFTITRNKIFNFLEAQRRRPKGSGDTDAHKRLEEEPAKPEEVREWDLEYDRKVFAWAADRIKSEFQETTWSAFRMTAVEGLSAKDVGEKLGMSPGAVYVAKSRVIARLRDTIAEIHERET